MELSYKDAGSGVEGGWGRGEGSHRLKPKLRTEGGIEKGPGKEGRNVFPDL